MNIYLVGQKWLGEQALAALAADGHEVVGVCAPGPADRLWQAAAGGSVPVIGNGDLFAGRLPAPIDLVVAAHAHVFIPAAVRDAARHGAVGYHPSLLPRHRGRDAVWWTILMGDPIAGGTVYQLDDGMDTGPVLARDWCFVRPGDTAALLWRRDLAPLGLRLLRLVVASIALGTAVAIPQDEALATAEPPIGGP